jgi:hypothetical protein
VISVPVVVIAVSVRVIVGVVVRVIVTVVRSSAVTGELVVFFGGHARLFLVQR